MLCGEGRVVCVSEERGASVLWRAVVGRLGSEMLNTQARLMTKDDKWPGWPHTVRPEHAAPDGAIGEAASSGTVHGGHGGGKTKALGGIGRSPRSNTLKAYALLPPS